MINRIDEVKDAYIFHSLQHMKLELAFQTLREIATCHDHPAWKHIQAIAKERDEHYEAYQKALDELIELSKDDFDDSSERL